LIPTSAVADSNSCWFAYLDGESTSSLSKFTYVALRTFALCLMRMSLFATNLVSSGYSSRFFWLNANISPYCPSPKSLFYPLPTPEWMHRHGTLAFTTVTLSPPPSECLCPGITIRIYLSCWALFGTGLFICKPHTKACFAENLVLSPDVAIHLENEGK
jgi:hypothetical protein